MISILIPTNRIGGMDLLLHSLLNQTEKDFELILVDSVRRWRNQFPPAPFWVQHISPGDPDRPNPFPYVAYCMTVNSGIAHARGDTLLFCCDYTFFSPRCLEVHAECQKKNPGPLHLDYNYTALPPLKTDFPRIYNQAGFHPTESPDDYNRALNDTTDRYVADLSAGKLDPFMWSIFEESPTQETIDALEVTHRHRPCATRKPDDWNWVSFKNESFPTELLLEMNGLDEAYDESHCWQDSEFSYRLREAGIPWQNGPVETGMVSVVNPREVLNVKKLRRPYFYNKFLCDVERVASKRLPVNPGFSLREWRERTIDE